MKKQNVYKSSSINTNMKRGLLVVFLAVFIIIISLNFVSADGGYFPSPGYWIQPGQQQAVIFHEDNTETMIVTSDFKGNAKNFAWIIPTPTKPQVTKASEEVFTNIQKLTQPEYDYGYSLGNVMMAATAERLEYGGVVVISQQQVDYYDVTTLLATNTQDLVNWFNENNYTYPEEYSYVLKSYIDKGWFFTAVKISAEALSSVEVSQDLREGHPTPLKLVFLSEKIVFPLKISSVDFEQGFKISTNLKLTQEAVNHLKDVGYDDFSEKTSAVNTFTQIISDVLENKAYNNSAASKYPLIIPASTYSTLKNYAYCDIYCVRSNLENAFRNYFSLHGISLGYDYGYYSGAPVNLYIIADSKYEADNFNIQYGNWFKKKQIEKIGDDENGNPYIKPEKSKYYITRMYAYLQKSQMDEDLILKKADDNKKVNAGPETWQLFIYGLLIGLMVFFIWLFTPLGIMFVAGVLMIFLSSTRAVRIVGWVLEIVSLAITLIFTLVFLAIAASNDALGNYIVVSVLITALLVFALMILFMVLEARYKGQENVIIRRK